MNLYLNLKPSHLWNRECGIGPVLRLALPLAISTLSISLLYFCDRLFLTWYNREQMSAVLQAGALAWCSYCLPLGIISYATTFVAQYRGNNQHDMIAKTFWQSARLALVISPLFLVLAILAEPMFRLFGHGESILWYEVTYFQIVELGAPAALFAAAFNSIFIGSERTKEVMYVDTFACALNIVLDYAMIFGIAPFPEMGIAGAAWATTISMWVKVAIFAYLATMPANRPSFQHIKEINWELLRRLVTFGGPAGFQFLFESGTFTLFLMFIAKLGTSAAAATSLAISVNLFAFVPVIGIGMAVTTLVGNELGRNRPDLAVRATISGQIIAIAYSLVFAGLYFFFPQLFLLAHDLSLESDNALQDEVVFLLRFVAAYCIFDAVQLVFVSGLKGAGDTRFILAVFGISMLVIVGLGVLGVEQFESTSNKLAWWWLTITIWVWMLAAVFGYRFFRGKWQQMRVIAMKPDVARESEDLGAVTT